MKTLVTIITLTLLLVSTSTTDAAITYSGTWDSWIPTGPDSWGPEQFGPPNVDPRSRLPLVNESGGAYILEEHEGRNKVMKIQSGSGFTVTFPCEIGADATELTITTTYYNKHYVLSNSWFVWAEKDSKPIPGFVVDLIKAQVQSRTFDGFWETVTHTIIIQPGADSIVFNPYWEDFNNAVGQEAPYVDSMTVATVPEPMAMSILALGAMAISRRRKLG